MFAHYLQKRVVRGLVAIACLALLSGVTRGAEVLLSGFETDMSTSIPGVSWEVGSSLMTQIVSGIPGTSEGSNVLQVDHPAIWNGDPFIRLNGQDVARAVAESTALKFDLIAPQNFAWRQAFVIMHGSPVNWNDTQTQLDLMAGPDTAYTAEFDLTKDYRDANGVMRPLNEIARDAFDQDSDWFQVVIVFQGQDQGDPPPDRSIVYIDNIRLVQPDVIAVDGDYNNDGSVDAADFVAWRANQGAPAGTLPNDPTGVAIGQEQYNLWVRNFGAGGSAPAGLVAAAVPEPGTFAVGALLLVSLTSFHARSWSKRK